MSAAIPSSDFTELTRAFNSGRKRAVLCGGQAVVLHRLAITSKDGDWIVREDSECTSHILRALADRRSRYRFGAPLDARWLAGGWSSHLEYLDHGLRVRTDFFSRPPRLDREALAKLWMQAEVSGAVPYADAVALSQMKMTNREKDYVIIGELARSMTDRTDRLLYSRSARDLRRMAEEAPELTRRLSGRRPLLSLVGSDEETLAAAIDAERRSLIRANEARVGRFLKAAERWQAVWPSVERKVAMLPLLESHEIIVREAEGVLPFVVEGSE